MELNTRAIIKAYKGGESAASLARRFKVSVWTILNRLRAADVGIRTRVEQNERRLQLKSKQAKQLRSIVDGLLLGDGSIEPEGALRLEQAKRRLGWIKAVSKRLEALGASSRIVKIPPRIRILEGRQIKSKGGYLLYTPAYVELKVERARWYPKGVKRVPSDVVLDPVSVAYWLCGDGTYDKQGSLSFCTNGFQQREVKKLAARLTDIDIEARCTLTGRPGEYNVSITKRDAAQRLKEFSGSYVPQCCRYKFRYVRPTLSPAERSALRYKLTNKQIRRLKAARKRKVKMTALAKKFNVDIKTLYNALNR